MPKFGHSVPNSINFLILAKFRMYPFSNMLIPNLTLVLENFESKKYQLSNLNEILPVPYFEGADFKS